MYDKAESWLREPFVAEEAGFSWLCARANEQSATADAQADRLRTEAPRRAA